MVITATAAVPNGSALCDRLRSLLTPVLFVCLTLCILFPASVAVDGEPCAKKCSGE